MRNLLFIIVAATCNVAFARPDSTWQLSAYIETYFAYDANRPDDHLRPSFLYNHNRHNEVSINLAYLKASYNTSQVRGNLALMAGTYAQYNLAAEPTLLRSIFEANAGIKLSRNKNLWLDAGIFVSHIGFESAITKDCWTLTRSLLAENSPYYESGLKLNYTSSTGKWYMAGLILNGWQRISRPDGNQSLAVGTQLTFKPHNRLTLNSSTFVGNDKPQANKQIRYFHNFYGIFQFSSQWGMTLGLDNGWEQRSPGSAAFNNWYSPVGIVRYTFSDRWAAAGRVEYYHDRRGVIINATTPNGTQIRGLSCNLDFSPNSHALWRIEARQLKAQEPIFSKSGKPSQMNFCLTTSLAVAF